MVGLVQQHVSLLTEILEAIVSKPSFSDGETRSGKSVTSPAERPPAGTRTGFVFVILPHPPIKAATIPGGEKELRGEHLPGGLAS